MTRRKYIPIDPIWKETYARPEIMRAFTLIEKVPLSTIKIDKRHFSWQNDVDFSQVEFILMNFNRDFWMPILVNRDYFLLDGQHRLQVAKRLGLELIDVVIDNYRQSPR